MLHPTLETLLFLKVARNTVCENIDNSNVEDKVELKNYIQNEASDYEIMHLITLDEMPDVKFNPEAEAMVWEHFKRNVVTNFNYVAEGVYDEDINTIIFEMGPVSDMGYSSAGPIFEFAMAQGSLDYDVLEERRTSSKISDSDAIGAGINSGKSMAKKRGAAIDAAKKGQRDSDSMSANMAAGNKMSKETKYTSSERRGKADSKRLTAQIAAQNAEKARRKLDADKQAMNPTASQEKGMSKNQKIAAGVGAVGLAAAAGFGLYKWIKKMKAKRAAAKTPEAKAAIDKAIASKKAKAKAKA